MAVTTLASVEVGFLPTDVGPGPYPDIGVEYWWDVRNSLITLRDSCVSNLEGGMHWYRKL